MNRFEFFSKIDKKYNLEIDKKKVICIRADGKGITSNKKINLLDEKKGSFSDSLKECAKLFSIKYQDSLVFCATDEIDFLFLNIDNFLNNYSSNRVQEFCSLFSQELFLEFNKIYNETIFFKCTVFGLYRKNIWSYIISRKHDFVSNLSVYYLKRFAKNYNRKNKSFLEINEYANNNVKGYKDRTLFQKEGLVYYKGKEFSFEEILKNHDLDDLYKLKYGEYFEDDII